LKIELLYVAQCPFHLGALRRLRYALASEQIHAEIHQVEIKDADSARALAFRGSPTIRINGRDVAGDSPEDCPAAISCRIYSGGELAGVPPMEMLWRAIREAKQRENP
jgi:hypothetical protein